jgi:hypothetical protein
VTQGLASAANRLPTRLLPIQLTILRRTFMQREAQGMRPGGYGLLLAGGTVDELIYSEIGNEALLIKYVDS